MWTGILVVTTIIICAVAAAVLIWLAIRHSDNGHVPAEEPPPEGSAMAVALAAQDAERELDRALRMTEPNARIGRLLLALQAFKLRHATAWPLSHATEQEDASR